jgi:hypothetical protein
MANNKSAICTFVTPLSLPIALNPVATTRQTDPRHHTPLTPSTRLQPSSWAQATHPQTVSPLLPLRLLPKHLIPPLHSSPISPSSPSLLQLPSLLFRKTIYIPRLSRIVDDFSGSVINPILVPFLSASLSGVKAPICFFDAGRVGSTATVGGDGER